MHAAATATPEPMVLRSAADGVVTLALNRPRQYNALSGALLIELQAALDAVARDASARVVVIAGAGKAFCAGHDLTEMHEHRDRRFIKDLFDRCNHLMTAITRMPQPVIARVHGFAAAAGCQLVAQCDLAVASEDAQFATSGIKYGLFCATPAVPLSRNVSRKQAMEMLLTGDFIDARTALAHGLVNRVVPKAGLDAEVARLAQAITAKSPAAVAAGKKMFHEQIELGLEEAYALASEAITCGAMSEDGAEGIAAFVEKRKPVWKDK